MGRPTLHLWFLFFCIGLCGTKRLNAQPYNIQHYEVEQGLSNNSVICTLQDKYGFIWFGTKDGLNRFDGYNIKLFRYSPIDSNSTIKSNYIRKMLELDTCLLIGTDKGIYSYQPKTEKFSPIIGLENTNTRDFCVDKENNIWFIDNVSLAKYNAKSHQVTWYNGSQAFMASSMAAAPDGSIWVSSYGSLYEYIKEKNSFKQYNLFDHSPEVPSKWIETLYIKDDNDIILIGTASQGLKLFDRKTKQYRDLVTQTSTGHELFVRDILKVNDKYWIGTESGIIIYNLTTDSYSNLQKDFNNPYSLSDNAIYSLYQDQEGGIWAGTYFGGVNYFPKQYTPFSRYYPDKAEASISGNDVREFAKDKYGNLWIGTEDAGLNKYDTATQSFVHYNTANSKLSYNNIHGLATVGDELWVGTFEHGLNILDVKTGKVIKQYTSEDQSSGLKNNFIYTIGQTSKNRILLGTTGGLYEYIAHKDQFEFVPGFNTNYLYSSILEDSHGTLWVGTHGHGVFFYNPITRVMGQYAHEDNNLNSLIYNVVTNLFEDSQNNLWITTENGLSKLNPTTGKFTHYTLENGMPSNMVFAIKEDNNHFLWISTSKGLVQLNPRTNDINVFTKDQGLLSNQFNYSSSYKDENGRLYFGTVKGMISFNPDKFQENRYIPQLHITGLYVNNTPYSELKGMPTASILYADEITLQYDQANISLDFAALTYTAPKTTQYKFRLKGLQKNWTTLTTNRRIYFTELPPGEYLFQVKAANTSNIWTEQPKELKITILPPIWATVWAYLFYIIIASVVLYFIFRTYSKSTEKKNERKINLLQSQKEKEIYQAKIEFFTNVAHEIRTPLTLITAPLDKLINAELNKVEMMNNLKVMQKNTNRLLELTNQLLDFRKTEIKQFSLTFVKANIKQILQETYLRFEPFSKQRDIQFNLHLPESNCYAYVDPEAFTKILSNLLNNALKYAAGKVSVTLHEFELEKDQNFVLEVSNDGLLIPEDQKERIFEPFHRLEETQEKEGTGIGLPLARSLAELHTGSLTIKKKTAPYNTFILTLPVRQANEFNLYIKEEANSAKEAEKANANGQTSKPVILLVEDNLEMVDFISSELKAEYHFIIAHNGKDGLDIINNENINLVISDVTMPVMSGLELCYNVKTNVEYSHIPVILLTAKNSMQAKIEGLESGADAYIEKPFSLAHLNVQIKNLLANKNKIKEYFANSPLTHIKTMAHSKTDEQFLEKLNEAIYANISDTDLNVEYLADIMNMSRPTLYRKIKAVSNLTPNELINLARLKKAAELLMTGDHKIYEVSYMVGYNSQTSFGRNFQKQFGMTPTEFINQREGSK